LKFRAVFLNFEDPSLAPDCSPGTGCHHNNTTSPATASTTEVSLKVEIQLVVEALVWIKSQNVTFSLNCSNNVYSTKYATNIHAVTCVGKNHQ